MRFKSFLSEITRIDSYEGTKDDIQMHLGTSSLKFEKMTLTAKPLPGGSGFRYYVEKDRAFISIAILDEKEVIGLLELSLFDRINGEEYWTVETVTVTPEYKGRKLGLSLYGLALTVLRLNLVSGDSQTKQGEKMWKAISTIPGVEVEGLISTAALANQTGLDGIAFEDFITKAKAYYLNKHRILFPVNKDLENPYIKIYDGEDVSSAYLIAKWADK